MIAIIDYDMGNLRSLENALDRLGATYCVTADPDTIRKADKVILPGVGHAGLAMDNLVERGRPAVIRALRVDTVVIACQLTPVRLRLAQKVFAEAGVRVTLWSCEEKELETCQDSTVKK